MIITIIIIIIAIIITIINIIMIMIMIIQQGLANWGWSGRRARQVGADVQSRAWQ